MTYSDHAREQMIERNITEGDVEEVIANPSRGTYEPQRRDRREHFGFSLDGRPLNVVTDRVATIVITVILQ